MSGTWTRENICQKLSRKKANDEGSAGAERNRLKRVLNIYDLTALGTGSTLGCGVYVLAGTVARENAGPAVVLSFILAAIVSSFSGVCYAEFAGRVPRAGSAYIYSYVVVGELVAFIIGWDLLLEHTLGNAAVAKAMSNYLDSLLGDPQKKFMGKYFPIDIPYLCKYPDVASFVFVMSIALLVAWGVRKSSTINNIFTTLNLFTVCTVIFSGFYFSNFANWSIEKSSIPPTINGGEGGFLPFGWSGIVTGAARCFYGFIGFDSIASTGEETKDPKRTIPLSIVLSLFFVTVAYSGVASVLTLMAPYFALNKDAPFPVIYENLNQPVLKYLVTGGAVVALFTTLIGTLFPIPRYLYAMSSDGLLFNFLSKINEKTKTPFVASIICGICAGLLSSLFDVDQLVQMTAIGTLQSYTIVCVCVLVLRYRNNNLPRQSIGNNHKTCYTIAKWFNWSNTKLTNPDTQYVSRVLIAVYSVTALVFCLLTNDRWFKLEGAVQLALRVTACVSFVILLIVMFMLSRLPQAVENLSFKVPLVPFVPCISIVLNFYLMVALELNTWIRFIVWLIIGLFVYAFYGIHHSVEGQDREARAEEEIRLEPENST